MKFIMEINLDNAAFDDACRAIEIQRLLKVVYADLVASPIGPHYTKTLWDANGNVVGEARVT